MFKGSLLPPNGPDKGYRTTYQDHIEYSRTSSDVLKGGPVVVSADGGDPASSQLWKSVQDAIIFSTKAALPLLNLLGVFEKDKFPFCQEIDSPLNLHDGLIKYLSCMFKYDGISGKGEDGAEGTEGDDEAEDGGGSAGAVQAVADSISQFAKELLEISCIDNNVVVVRNEDNGGGKQAACL